MFFTLSIILTNLTTNPSNGIVSNNMTQKITNKSITIPAICNEQKCLPQLYVSIPINQTLIKNMSNQDLINFKNGHLMMIGKYFDDILNMAKTDSLKIKMDVCHKFPPSNIDCIGIRPPTDEETGGP
jgi:hypothetical protein